MTPSISPSLLSNDLGFALTVLVLEISSRHMILHAYTPGANPDGVRHARQYTPPLAVPFYPIRARPYMIYVLRYSLQVEIYIHTHGSIEIPIEVYALRVKLQHAWKWRELISVPWIVKPLF